MSKKKKELKLHHRRKIPTTNSLVHKQILGGGDKESRA